MEIVTLSVSITHTPSRCFRNVVQCHFVYKTVSDFERGREGLSHGFLRSLLHRHHCNSCWILSLAFWGKDYIK